MAICVVRHGHDLHIRSVDGPTAWFRRTQVRRGSHTRAGGAEKELFRGRQP